MNAINKKILNELKKNSRQTNKEMAKKLKISEGTVRNRIRRMVDENIIKRFTIALTTTSGFMAYVLVECEPNTPTTDIARKISRIKDVASVYETAGRWDIVIKVDTESAESFNRIIESIRSVRGVMDTETITVLKIN